MLSSSKIWMFSLFALALTLGVCAQTVRVIDNKGTLKDIEQSKWKQVGNDIYNKNTGNVGIGTSTPMAKFDNEGATILGSTALSNFTTNTMLTAFATVDAFSGAVITQTTPGISLTLPSPSNSTAGRIFQVSNSNTSTQSITVGGVTLAPGSSTNFRWDGGAWSTLTAATVTSATNDWHLTGNSGTSPVVLGASYPTALSSSNNWVGTTDAKDFIIGTSSNERLRVTSVGNIGIGTTNGNNINTNYLMTVNPNATIGNGISMSLSGVSGNVYGLNISTGTSAANGVLFTSTSTGTGFYGMGSVLNSTNIVSGYLGYRNGSGVSYGLYGVNGTSGTYATASNTYAAFLQGRTVISSETSPTSPVGVDLEIRNTNNAPAPVVLSLRESGSNNTTAGTPLASINFGDNGAQTSLNPEAQIQALRDLPGTSGLNSTDLPTALTFSTTPDGSATIAERMRISNAGNVGIGTTSPSTLLHINSSSSPAFRLVDGTQGVGKVLTSDASGNASWSGISSIGSISLSTGTTGIAPSWSVSPVSLGGSTQLNIPMASTSSVTAGVISNSDYTAFANKIGAVTATTPTAVSTSGTTVTILNTGAYWNANQLQGKSISTTAPTDGQILTYNGTSSKWEPVANGGSGWLLTGNAGTSPGTNFLGTTDNVALQFKVNNTLAGYLGTNNASATAFGYNADAAIVWATGTTAIGSKAQAVNNNATAIGSNAYAVANSTVLGASANASGQNATALGSTASATSNDAVAIGSGASAKSQEGIAIGKGTNVDVKNNGIAIGSGASANSQDGIAIGTAAKVLTYDQAIAIGSSSSASGYQSTALGNGAKATAQNATAIGNGAVANTANTVILGSGANVGIGTSAPSVLLHINGGTTSPAFRLVDGTQGAGKVLVSDNLGNASWSSSAIGWNLMGNAGTTAGTNFAGTTDAQDFVLKANNTEGFRVLQNGDTKVHGIITLGYGNGSLNTILGKNALTKNGGANSGGDKNTVIGALAMDEMGPSANGEQNVAVGYLAGHNLFNGGNNIFLGANALPIYPGVDNNNTLNIGNTIYGLNIGQTGSQIGIATKTPTFTTPANTGATIPTLGVDGTVNATNYTSPVQISTSVSGTFSWDLSKGANAKINLSGNVTVFTITNAKPGMYGTLIISQPASAYYTFPTSTANMPATSKVINGGGGLFYLTAANGATDVVCFFYDGTTFWWTIGNNYN